MNKESKKEKENYMKKIAILLENMFDEQEVIYPFHRLREDYEVELIGTKADEVYKSKVGFSIKSDKASSEVSADDYDGVFIPGGFSPDFMRRSEDTVKFLKDMDEKKKPIGAICHGGWMLASAVDIKGKKVTSFYSIKDDLINAGAEWVDEEVVVDGHIISGRTPVDLPAVIKAFIEKL